MLGESESALASGQGQERFSEALASGQGQELLKTGSALVTTWELGLPRG